MASPIGTKLYYDAAGGSSYTQFPNKLISISRTGGQTEEVPRGHLGAAFRATSPGGLEGGELTAQFEVSSPIDADFDMYQLVYGWWSNRTMGTAGTEGITLKTEFPKNSSDTTGPLRVHHGYVKTEPSLSSPENGRMVLDVVFKLIDIEVLTDGAA